MKVERIACTDQQKLTSFDRKVKFYFKKMMKDLDM